MKEDKKNIVNEEIEKILSHLIDNDITISVREVIRHHGTLKAPSSITRDPIRMELVERYKQKLLELRRWKNRAGKMSNASLSKMMAEKDSYIQVLEKRIQLLTASHAAMIRAVGENGGFTAWARFFEKYNDIKKDLLKDADLES